MKRSVSLRTRFSVIFAALVIGLTLILSFVINKKSSEKVRGEIGDSLSEIAFQMADKLDHYMWSRKGEVDIVSKLDDIREYKNISTAQILLEQLKSSFPAFSWIGITDTKGIIMAATGGILVGGDGSSRPVYTEGIKGPFIGDVHDAVLLAKLLPNPSGEPLRFVDISTPLYNKEGKVTGVFAAHLSWEWARDIERSIVEPLKNRKQIDIFVVSKTDNTVLLGPKNMIGQVVEIKSLSKARTGENSWAIETWSDGKSYLTGYAYADGYENYSGLGWTVLVRQPVDLAYASARELQSYIVFIGLVFAVIFAVIGWFMATKLARPLKEIASIANDLRLGNQVDIPLYRGISEIEVLSSSLRDLINSLTKTESALGKMENEAHHDRLTGLPNRLALDYYLEETVSQIQHSEGNLAFLYIDLDNFKPVNDTYGHRMGDLLLKDVATRLKANLRQGELVARLGGDEFVMALFISSNQPIEEARSIADHIVSDLKTPFKIKGINIQIGCSVGGAILPIDGTEPKEVIHFADEALYAAKRAGKNCVSFYSLSGNNDKL